MTTPPLPEQIELHRDRMWRRDEDLRVESAVDAERFIEDVGFANTLTDARRAGPSLYIAVCGRRDVSLPRHVQKDEETRLTWYLKDEVMRRIAGQTPTLLFSCHAFLCEDVRKIVSKTFLRRYHICGTLLCVCNSG